MLENKIPLILVKCFILKSVSEVDPEVICDLSIN